MEDINGSVKEDVKDFVFDSTNFELMAQGAEGVFFYVLLLLNRDYIKEPF